MNSYKKMKRGKMSKKIGEPEFSNNPITSAALAMRTVISISSTKDF